LTFIYNLLVCQYKHGQSLEDSSTAYSHKTFNVYHTLEIFQYNYGVQHGAVWQKPNPLRK